MTYTFDKNSANRIVDAVRKLEQQPSGGILRDTGTQISNDGGFWARIVSQDESRNSLYAFIMVGHDDLDFFLDTDVSSITIDEEDQYLAVEVNGNHYVPNDTLVRMYVKGDDTKHITYGFSWLTVGCEFLVKVTSDGGVAGDDTTDCTLTYSCQRLKTEVLAPRAIDKEISPEKKRYPKITYSTPEANSLGVAIYLPSLFEYQEDIPFQPAEIFKLLYVLEEVQDTDVCTPA